MLRKVADLGYVVNDVHGSLNLHGYPLPARNWLRTIASQHLRHTASTWSTSHLRVDDSRYDTSANKLLLRVIQTIAFQMECLDALLLIAN